MSEKNKKERKVKKPRSGKSSVTKVVSELVAGVSKCFNKKKKGCLGKGKEEGLTRRKKD